MSSLLRVGPLAALAAALPLLARGGGFLVERSSGHLDAQALDRELSAAMDEALGCGGFVPEERLVAIERKLRPIWHTLPKLSGVAAGEGSIDRRTLRYLVHRHFNRESALHIRGFEPSRPANTFGWGDADIISQRVPAFVESALESRHREANGFDIRDAAHMVATLEQLVFDFQGAVLAKAYEEISHPVDTSLSESDLSKLLEAYMIHWLVGDNQETVEILMSEEDTLRSTIPHWDGIAAFVRGQVKALDHRRETAPVAAAAGKLSRPSHNALEKRYSFEDAHGIVGDVTRSFASFWESECSVMKAQLVDMDVHRTGRVPLSKFYGTGLEVDWRFAESEQYLRELGALDETSWRGKQVIIPNYIQAASNCIVSSSHYLVCCKNDCEALFEEIEAAVGAPMAPPAVILAAVTNVSSHLTLDDDAPPALEGSPTWQLQMIADTHGGEVPLHGRLFAQWMHYAFPHECPFPHMTGTTSAVSPTEYGTGHLASTDDMRRQVDNATPSFEAADAQELEWMSQWSPEEELLTGHMSSSLRAPWEHGAAVGGVAALLLAAAVLAGRLPGRKADSDAGGLGATLGRGVFGLQLQESKAHFV